MTIKLYARPSDSRDAYGVTEARELLDTAYAWLDERQRLLARPSFARAVDDAPPFRAWFPLGAPDRD